MEPKCGRLVAFNAGDYHGVKAVTKGQRCAVAMWYTHNPDFTEVSRIHASRRLDALSSQDGHKEVSDEDVREDIDNDEDVSEDINNVVEDVSEDTDNVVVDEVEVNGIKLENDITDTDGTKEENDDSETDDSDEVNGDTFAVDADEDFELDEEGHDEL